MKNVVIIVALIISLVAGCSTFVKAEDKTNTDLIKQVVASTITEVMNSRTEVKQAATIQESEYENKVRIAKEWASLVSSTIKDTCSSLNIGINNFITTPVGLMAVGFTFYKIAGQDTLGLIKSSMVYLKNLFLKIPFFTGLILCMVLLAKKLYGTKTIYDNVEYKKIGWFTYHVIKTGKKTEPSFNWNIFELSGDDAIVWQIIILFIIIIVCIISIINIGNLL